MSKLIAIKKFKADVVRERSITPTVELIGNDLLNVMELYEYEDGKYGIEWEVYDSEGEYVEGAGIGIWTENGVVTDYDGTFSLPKEAIQLLKEQGFNTDDL